MNKTRKISRSREIPKTIEGLVKWHVPRPIHDDVALRNTTEILDTMAGHQFNADQQDYFELLCDAVEKYEKECHPMPKSKLRGLEALKFLMRENNMTPADLARLLGSDRTLGYKILKGERSLIQHLSVLASRFKVRADLFIE
jgi:HTH-type transcriptional regulator/antitoxin HigA